jgi:ABC-type transport system substrate-binding protein
MEAYGKRLREVDTELRKDMPVGARDLPWLDLRSLGFSGIEALDEHTLRIRVKGLYPQFKYWLAMTFVAPIPWEADRFYSQPGMAQRNLSLNHWPVGTGPYMLTESLQNRRHVLSRNPNFRGEPYPCEGEPGDQAAGLLADCGKMTPFIDRIVFNIEKESIPLQGKFMQGYYDIPQVDRGDTGVAMLVAASDSTEKAALYAKHGIQLPTTVEAQMQYFGFNWRDPVVGQGDTPEQQVRNRKLRQALSIAFNWEEFVAIFQNDQAQVAYGPIPPGILGYVSGEAGINRVVYDVKDGKPQRKPLDEARRLLAEAGYPNGRHEKTGAPLVLHFDSASGAGGSSPTLDWMRRQFANIGVQLDVRSTEGADAVVAAVEARHGKIDTIVANAGIAHRVPLPQLTDAKWDHTFDIDLKGIYRIVRPALPGMKARKSGSVIALSSIMGVAYGWDEHVHYSAAKAGVELGPPTESRFPAGTFILDGSRDPDRQRRMKGKKSKGWKEDAKQMRRRRP